MKKTFLRFRVLALVAAPMLSSIGFAQIANANADDKPLAGYVTYPNVQGNWGAVYRTEILPGSYTVEGPNGYIWEINFKNSRGEADKMKFTLTGQPPRSCRDNPDLMYGGGRYAGRMQVTTHDRQSVQVRSDADAGSYVNFQVEPDDGADVNYFDAPLEGYVTYPDSTGGTHKTAMLRGSFTRIAYQQYLWVIKYINERNQPATITFSVVGGPVDTCWGEPKLSVGGNSYAHSMTVSEHCSQEVEVKGPKPRGDYGTIFQVEPNPNR